MARALLLRRSITASIASLHAITRNRMLTAQVLGYAPDGPLDFGLDRAALTGGAQRA